MNNELKDLRALRDFILDYERTERIRDDYWDGPEGDFAIEYIQDAVKKAKETKEEES